MNPIHRIGALFSYDGVGEGRCSVATLFVHTKLRADICSLGHRSRKQEFARASGP